MDETRLTTPEILEDEQQFDLSLRPKKLEEFVGQQVGGTGKMFPLPRWAHGALGTQEWDAATGNYVYTNSLDKEGVYVIEVGKRDAKPEQNRMWICGPIVVTVAPSE